MSCARRQSIGQVAALAQLEEKYDLRAKVEEGLNAATEAAWSSLPGSMISIG
jgi:hypothetical protein